MEPLGSMWGKSLRSNWLLQYHGWSDQLISPRNSINYYKSVLDTMGGASKVDESYRLFMVPGMAHCSGGDGPTQSDTIGALEQWVEKGKPQTLASYCKVARLRLAENAQYTEQSFYFEQST